jgi:hypothetical protein
MAKGRASPTRRGSESPVNTSALPVPVRASETDFIAILFIEHELGKIKRKSAQIIIKYFVFIIPFL